LAASSSGFFPLPHVAAKSGAQSHAASGDNYTQQGLAAF